MRMAVSLEEWPQPWWWLVYAWYADNFRKIYFPIWNIFSTIVPQPSSVSKQRTLWGGTLKVLAVQRKLLKTLYLRYSRVLPDMYVIVQDTHPSLVVLAQRTEKYPSKITLFMGHLDLSPEKTILIWHNLQWSEEFPRAFSHQTKAKKIKEQAKNIKE